MHVWTRCLLGVKQPTVGRHQQEYSTYDTSLMRSVKYRYFPSIARSCWTARRLVPTSPPVTATSMNPVLQRNLSFTRNPTFQVSSWRTLNQSEANLFTSRRLGYLLETTWHFTSVLYTESYPNSHRRFFWGRDENNRCQGTFVENHISERFGWSPWISVL